MNGKECELNLLSQFISMKCEISINAYTLGMSTFSYGNFDCDIGEFKLCLFDSNDETLNTMLNNELIIKVKHLSDDLYNDVISIHTKDFIISVTTLETRPFMMV